jgi:hypothetical protein
MKRISALALVLCATCALAALPALGAADSPYEIRLLAATFTPPAGLSAAAGQALAERASALRARGQETIHVLVQLYAIPDEAAKNQLWRDGLSLGPYATGNAWIAAVSADRVGSIALRSDVRYLAHWDASLKVHPALKAGEVAPWALDPSRPGWVMAFVQLHHDVPLERGWDLAEAAGGVAMPPIEGLHGLTVWLAAEGVEKLARQEEVLWIQEGPAPLSPTNDGARALMNVNPVNGAPYSLDGTGVRVFVFDGGTLRATHETFNAGAGSRVTVIDGQAAADHPTHVGGTVGGDGAPTSSGGRARGVATDVTFLSAAYQQSGGTMLFWDNAGDIQADYALARTTHNADLGTNSIGSNTASNGYPCAREGDYDLSGSLLDGIVRGDNATVGSAVLMTWANGNERSGGSPSGRCGPNYVTTAPPSCAKNPIHVGAINSDGGSMTRFSSWGPCDDGRMKPTVSAAGCESGRVSGETFIYSSLNTSNTAYGGSGWCGTSMATPATAGVVSLFIEDWRSRGFGGPNDRPLPALVKAMLVHSARDQGQEGPDYIYGYGIVDAKALVDLERAGSGSLGAAGSAVWGTDSVGNGATDSFTISVPAGTGELKASLAWDDAAAAAFVASAPVNNLNLELVSPSATIFRPWVLSSASPHLAATTGVNSLDNQEQVVVANPAAGIWTVRVLGSSVPTGPQSYGLAYSTKPADTHPCTTTSYTYEAGNDGWTLSGGAARVAAPAAGHGSFSLRLGGGASTTHEATIDVAVPAGASRAEWSYFWYMTTDEVAASGWHFDFNYAEVRNTSGAPLAVFDVRDDSWREAAWMDQQNIDLTPWAGQTVRLAFRGTNDSSLVSSFYLDDVAFTTCSGGGGGNTPPTVTITAPADGASVSAGTSVTFSGTATDTQDGNISANLTWTSSINGTIGSGASFSTSALSVGTHTITASVTDSGGLPGSDANTLTVTAGSVTVTFTSTGSQDGRIFESTENAEVGGGFNSTDTGTAAIRVGDWSDDTQYRSIVSFDTSSLPDGATVTAATLQLRRGTSGGTNPFGTHGTCTVDVRTGFFGTGSALAAADWQAAATAAGVATMSNPTTNGALSTGTLNATGRAAINKTGLTQFKLYMTLGDNDDLGADYIGFYPGENGTAANRPTLTVTYTP